MELILWRHADAEDGWSDMDRALTAKGHKQAQQMAAWLKPRLPENTEILVSPAKRAQQTAAALGVDFTTLAEIGPGALPAAILQAAGWPHRSGNVLIVGHQPTLGMVAAETLASQDASWSIKKAAVWWLSSRSREDQSQTILRAVMSPDLL